jgi:class 3 adenylate cyclase/TolB-like protein
MERRLSAILAVDVVGYSRLMESDEAGTFERLRAHRKDLFEPEIAGHHGRIFKLTGDGLLAEFGSVVDAVECAVLLQREMAERNNGLSADRRIDVRMGLHVGDVIVEGDDRHGDAVNIAARLQQLAETGGICVSGTVVNHVRHKVALRFESRGEERLKNIAEPVVIHRIVAGAIPSKPGRAGRRLTIWASAAAIFLLLIAGGVATALYGIPVTTAPPPLPDSTLAAKDQGIPVIIVLPFQDLTGDETQSGLGKGIAEAFITDLATFPDFEVVSSTSSFAYAGRPVPEIFRDTGALFVIEGSFRRSAGKVAVTMQLIRGDTDRHLKIAQIEEPMTDPVSLQSAVASSLRDELGGMTGILRQEYNRIALTKPEADRTEYDYYVLGHIDSLHGRGEAAGRVWKEGLARFPKSALLHYKLMIYHLDEHNDVKQAEMLWAEAETLERRSSLDDWYRHWLSSWLHGWRGDFRLAVAEAKATIAMAPYDAISHVNLCWVMWEAGEAEQAVDWAKFAVTHDPNMFKFYFRTLTQAYNAAGTWTEAVTFAEAQVVKDPVHAKWWYEFLSDAYSKTGQKEKSQDAWKKTINLPEPPTP